MEKLPSIVAPASKPKLAPAVLALLSTVAAGCTRTIYVPVYQSFPEDTGYMRPEENEKGEEEEMEEEVEEMEEEEEEEVEDGGREDSGLADTLGFAVSAEECGRIFDDLDMTNYIDEFTLLVSRGDLSQNPILTLRYEDFWGRPLPAEGFQPLVEVFLSYSTDYPGGISYETRHCYPLGVSMISLYSFVVTYDISCGADLAYAVSGLAIGNMLVRDVNNPCVFRPHSVTGRWRFRNGAFDEYEGLIYDGPIYYHVEDTGFDSRW